MCNISEPILPEVGIKQQPTDYEDIGIFLAIILWWIVPSVLYMIGLIFYYLGYYTWKKIKKMYHKCKKINSSTEIKWNNKNTDRGDCAGNCNCVHKVPETYV